MHLLERSGIHLRYTRLPGTRVTKHMAHVQEKLKKVSRLAHGLTRNCLRHRSHVRGHVADVQFLRGFRQIEYHDSIFLHE